MSSSLQLLITNTVWERYDALHIHVSFILDRPHSRNLVLLCIRSAFFSYQCVLYIFISLLSKHLLLVYYVPGTMPGMGVQLLQKRQCAILNGVYTVNVHITCETAVVSSP